MSTFDKVIFSDAQNCLQIKRDHKMIENHSGGEEKIVRTGENPDGLLRE